jgi:hypothetical protein
LLALALWTGGAAAAPELHAWAPGLQAAGSGRLTWFGLAAYDARLWAAPGFRHQRFAQHVFALELTYLRAFAAGQIARRSIDEMRRDGPLDDADATRWQEQLRAVLPDVRPGDRLTGLHRPGAGVLFLLNGRPAGEIADPRFGPRFFGIWLAPTTSAPGLREALLSGTAP